MDKHTFKQLMEGYLRGDLSTEDKELLQRWYDSFGESEIGVPGMEDDRAVQRLHDELDARIRQVIEHPSVGITRYHRRMSWKQIAAAAILIVTLGGAIWWTAGWQQTAGEAMAVQQLAFREVKTGIRQVKKLVLPDGSMIHVNANSAIRIPERMEDDKREVLLDEGEAYFEVAQEPKRPFVVRMADLQVEVLGTAFNVKSYHALEDITVAVTDGKVRVRDTTRILRDLAANEGLVYHKLLGEVRSTGVAYANANGWISGVVPLEKAGFDELALALYNLYGVRLKSKDPRTVHHHYNLSLRADRPLEETMGVICGIHKTTYRRTGNEITLYP
ncbi:anti-sigma factor [Parapedobacter defluvii]|uniref:Anti-sigma factor n=1 Tax=Parapedobacter defluvii TaxID=2045106 RepID=A0ABQ1LHS5_9SPHI|nr:FecR family protein [Parapedobacter defluvii]GGC23615.1 anti-sigma factor [Parapedobacter defluvii]